MPFTLTMPKLSPTMETGVIAKWRKKEGDLVKAGEVIFEVATDKATVEHSALDGGYLRKILVQEGVEVPVGKGVAIFTEKATESIDGYRPEEILPEAPKKMSPVQEVTRMPKPSKEPSAQPLSSLRPEAPLSGTKRPPSGAIHGDRSLASPFARKVAADKGIDLSTVPGSGPGGRVVSRDLDLGQPNVAVPFKSSTEIPSIPPGTYEEEKPSPIRKVTGERLQASKSTIPHFYLTQVVRAERLLDAREQLKNGGHKVSINDFVIRACALALKSHPQVNSGFYAEHQTILRFKTIDIAVAVSLDDGLITPIIRHADYKNLGQIAAEMKMLATRAREGKLSREEYMGGSFTISNLGMAGISEFVAVINPPQAAILAVGTIEDVPVVEKGMVIPGKQMVITLSADHRVIDGLEGAKFLKTVQNFLENPSMLVM
jgi:pyruvate dehydrogenase E2 component (dihydrolipoamide acetyltransferase)